MRALKEESERCKWTNWQDPGMQKSQSVDDLYVSKVLQFRLVSSTPLNEEGTPAVHVKFDKSQNDLLDSLSKPTG